MANVDTYDEHMNAYKVLYSNSAVDIIDVHYYPQNKEGYFLSCLPGSGCDSSGRLLLDDKGYMKIAQSFAKPLMYGEFARLPVPKSDRTVWDVTPNYFESYTDPAALGWTKKTLDSAVGAGVQLAYWWAYSSDRAQDINDPNRFDIEMKRNPQVFKLISDANRALKVKLGAK